MYLPETNRKIFSQLKTEQTHPNTQIEHLITMIVLLSCQHLKAFSDRYLPEDEQLHQSQQVEVHQLFRLPRQDER